MSSDFWCGNVRCVLLNFTQWKFLELHLDSKLNWGREWKMSLSLEITRIPPVPFPWAIPYLVGERIVDHNKAYTAFKMPLTQDLEALAAGVFVSKTIGPLLDALLEADLHPVLGEWLPLYINATLAGVT